MDDWIFVGTSFQILMNWYLKLIRRASTHGKLLAFEIRVLRPCCGYRESRFSWILGYRFCLIILYIYDATRNLYAYFNHRILVALTKHAHEWKKLEERFCTIWQCNFASLSPLWIVNKTPPYTDIQYEKTFEIHV